MSEQVLKTWYERLWNYLFGTVDCEESVDEPSPTPMYDEDRHIPEVRPQWRK